MRKYLNPVLRDGSVIAAGRSFTADELVSDIELAASELPAQGTVAFVCERSYSSVIFLLAALRKNLVFTFLDPALSEKSVLERCQDAGVTHKVIPGQDWQFRDGALWACEQVSTPPGVCPKWDYVAFSSGSTGKPKAIAGNMEGVAEFVSWQQDTFGIHPKDVFLNITQPYFDVYLRDILTPLSAGSTVVVPGEAELTHVGNTLAQHGITCLHVVPSVANRLFLTSEVVPTLRYTFFAGEPLYKNQVDRWKSAFPTSGVVNLYGPTECTLASFWHEVTAADVDPLPVGTPIGGATFEISKAGNINIHNPTASHGYLSNGTLSCQFHGTFETSDRGTVRDSKLVVLGRTDSRVKYFGEFVDLQEAEMRLCEHSAVAEAAVVAVDERLIAFVESKNGCTDFRRVIQEQLIPVLWGIPVHIVPEMPLLPNGKKDRESLRKRAEVIDFGVEPARNDNEKLLLAVVSQVLSGYQLGCEVDLFQFGLTSIDVVRIVALVREQGYSISPINIFEHRTIRGIAKEMRSVSKIREIPVEAGEEHDWTSLTPQQRRYVRVYLPFGNRTWATMKGSLKVAGSPSGERVLDAIGQIIQRHSALRTVFQLRDGVWKQKVLPWEQVSHRVAELLVDDQVWGQRFNEPIDITRWPLLTFRMLPEAEGFTLEWVIHHLVSDGASQAILRNNLEVILLRGEKLPEIPGYLAVSGAARPHPASVRYWEQVFKVPYMHHYLPASREDADGYRAVYTVPVDFLEQATYLGVTPFSLLVHRMYQFFFGQYGYQDLVIGTPAAGRLHPQAQNTIGIFISLVVIRARAAERLTARMVQERIIRAMEYQDYQYDELMDLLGIEESEDRFPLTTYFASQVEHSGNSILPETGDSSMGVLAKFDLMTYLHVPEQRDEAWKLEIQYRESIFSKEAIDRAADCFLGGMQ